MKTELIEAGSGKIKKNRKSLRRLLKPEYIRKYIDITVPVGYSGIIDPDLKQSHSIDIKEMNKDPYILGQDGPGFQENTFFKRIFRDEIVPLDKVVAELFYGAEYTGSMENKQADYIDYFFQNIPKFKQIKYAQLTVLRPRKPIPANKTITFDKFREGKGYFVERSLIDRLTLSMIFRKPPFSGNNNQLGLVIPLVLNKDWRIKHVYYEQRDWVKPYFKRVIGHVFSVEYIPGRGEVMEKNTPFGRFDPDKREIRYLDGYFSTRGLIKGIKSAIGEFGGFND